MREHKDTCSQGQLEELAIVVHTRNHDHPLKSNHTEIVDHARTLKGLIVKEVLNILEAPEEGSLNKNGVVELHQG